MTLSSIPTAELFSLYDSRRARATARAKEGREPLTLWYESRIIEELATRKLSRPDRRHRKSILLTHQYEQASLALHLDLPLTTPTASLTARAGLVLHESFCSNKALSPRAGLVPHESFSSNKALSPCAGLVPHESFSSNKALSPAELLHLIRHYSSYRDFPTRELLIEYTDQAITLFLSALSQKDKALSPTAAAGLSQGESIAPSLPAPLIELAAELTDLHRRGIISIPAAIPDSLREIAATSDGPAAIIPLLTISLLDNAPTLERKAIRLLNRLHRSLLTAPEQPVASPSSTTADLSQVESTLLTKISHLHLLTLHADYLTRFSPRKAARLLQTLSTEFLTLATSSIPPSSPQSPTIPRAGLVPCESFSSNNNNKSLPLLQLIEIQNHLLPHQIPVALTTLLTILALQGDLLARLHLPATLLPSSHKTAI